MTDGFAGHPSRSKATPLYPDETMQVLGHHGTCPSSRSQRGSGPSRRDSREAPYAGMRLRGRPPLAPFVLAAAAFALERRWPPRCPVARANKRVPNARSTSPGTCTSRSSDGQDKASPAGETLIPPSADAGTSSRPGMICRGIVIDPPLRNLRSIASRVASYCASTTADGSCARACPRARAWA
jgi:hypothetical protein